jgi:hypothetical protein
MGAEILRNFPVWLRPLGEVNSSAVFSRKENFSAAFASGAGPYVL